MVHQFRVMVSVAGCLTLAACDGTSIPAGVRPTPVPVVNLPFAVLNGVTGERVAGAHVIGPDGHEFVSNGAGDVVVTSPSSVPVVEVHANGYLDRRTHVSGAAVTLWPAADEESAEAIEAMVFGDAATRRAPVRTEPFYVDLSRLGIDDLNAVEAVWTREIGAFAKLTGADFEIHDVFNYDQEILVEFGETDAACVSPSWGFCGELVDRPLAIVRPELATDPVVIRRVLASAVLYPNPQPGLLNVAHPADQLSPLEIDTIRMLFVRNGITFSAPDFDAPWHGHVGPMQMAARAGRRTSAAVRQGRTLPAWTALAGWPWTLQSWMKLATAATPTIEQLGVERLAARTVGRLLRVECEGRQAVPSEASVHRAEPEQCRDEERGVDQEQKRMATWPAS
jgi:hypothetical protein